MSVPVQELLRLTASPAGLLQIATDLRIGDPPLSVRTAAWSREVDLGEQRWLARDGFARVEAVVAPGVSDALVRGIRALRARELPAAFVYAFDEPWAVGESVRERISALTGHAYAVVEDVWAWEIPPGQGGWAPHRGNPRVRLDREGPEIINVWVALSEVTAERGCMHAIPLDDDPGYPDALARVDGPLDAVRALPANAGDALFWNANVLHWGGRCTARAAGPRVSCSFTLCRADARSRFPELTMLPPPPQLTLTRRMDVLAGMVLLYGQGQPDVSESVREWAGITHGLATRFSPV